MSPPAEPAAPQRRHRRALGWLRLVVGVGLLALAIGVVFSQREVLAGAAEAARGAPWWLAAALLVLPIGNWLATGTGLWALNRRHAPVEPGEMQALVGAAWLLNYLPMRPGLVGRIAYHRAFNDIRVVSSLVVLGVSVAMTCAAALLMLAVAWGLGDGRSALAWAAALAVPLIVAGGVAIGRARRQAASTQVWWQTWHWPAAFAARYADVLLWTARYAAVFAVVGAPVSFAQAVVIAAVSQLVMLVPLSGNGLGLREWAVGLTAASMPAWPGAEGGTAVGLAADLVNRAAEVLVAVPVGLLALAWLARHRRSAAETGRGNSPGAGGVSGGE